MGDRLLHDRHMETQGFGCRPDGLPFATQIKDHRYLTGDSSPQAPDLDIGRAIPDLLLGVVDEANRPVLDQRRRNDAPQPDTHAPADPAGESELDPLTNLQDQTATDIGFGRNHRPETRTQISGRLLALATSRTPPQPGRRQRPDTGNQPLAARNNHCHVNFPKPGGIGPQPAKQAPGRPKP